LPISSFTVHHILNNPAIYEKPEGMRRAVERVTGKGILTAIGERHKKQRKVLNPAFSASHIRLIVPIFLDKASQLVEILLDEIKLQPLEGINVEPLLSRLTLDIIGSSGTPLF
jgi:cytochrome P450